MVATRATRCLEEAKTIQQEIDQLEGNLPSLPFARLRFFTMRVPNLQANVPCKVLPTCCSPTFPELAL